MPAHVMRRAVGELVEVFVHREYGRNALVKYRASATNMSCRCIGNRASFGKEK
jgi:hypothetical protein